jgi:hypothetical protein
MILVSKAWQILQLQNILEVERLNSGGNASNSVSSRAAPGSTADTPTTRSGLVRHTPVATAVEDENNEGENRMVTPKGEDQGPEQPQTEFQILLRANNELMIRVDRMSEAYAKTLTVVTTENALYGKELEESRREVRELQKEIVSLKELVQSLSVKTPTTQPHAG